MAIIYDSLGNEIRSLDIIGGEALIDPRAATSTIGAVNAEVFFDCAGTGAAAIDVRGTFVATLLVEATIDGINYFNVAIMVPTTETFAGGMTAPGVYITHLPAACRRVRVRCSAYTSGAAVVALRASGSENFVYAKPIPVTSVATVLSAANATATLALSAPAGGMFHYITAIEILRINGTGTPVAGSALLAYTTTNLPGTLAFSAGNAIAAGQSIIDVSRDFSVPMKSIAGGSNSTIVAPAAGAGVQVRMTAWFYVGA